MSWLTLAGLSVHLNPGLVQNLHIPSFVPYLMESSMLTTLTAAVKRLRNDDRGVTALEYGVIAAAIVVTGLALLPTLGTTLNTLFTSINTKL